MKSMFGNFGDIINSDGGLNQLLEESNRFSVRIGSIRTFGQVRNEFNEKDLNELAESIKKVGVLQNIIVNEKTDDSGISYYNLIAGERRFRAAKIANLIEIPALILNVSDDEALQIQILENIQRENLNAIDLANALDKELEALNGDYELLAEKYNKSRGWLSKALQMNKMSGAAKEAMTVSADQEVILSIKQLEKTNPAKAAEVVQEIKKDIGKKNVRKTVKEAVKIEKEEQKSKKQAEKPKKQNADFDINNAKPAFPITKHDKISDEQESEVKAFLANHAEKDISEDECGGTTENQDIINFGSAIDIFCFKGKEIPDATFDVVSKQSELFKDIYEKAGSENKFNDYFLKTLKAAGFKIDLKNANLAALIELVILVNSTDVFNLDKLTLNIRDTLEILKNENE